MKIMKKKMKYLLILLVALCATILTVTACRNNGDDGDVAQPSAENPVSIDFWHIWPEGDMADYVDNLLDEFMETNQYITINQLGITFWDYWDRLNPSLAAGTTPDLMIGDLSSVRLRAMEGQVMNLQPYFDAADITTNMFFPASKEQSTWEGDMFAFPFLTDTRVLYWNKDHFEEVGLDPEQPPTTWDEVLRFNELLTVFADDDRNFVDRMGFSTRLGNFWPWTLVWTFGGELWDTDHTVPTFTSPPVLQALNFAHENIEQVGLSGFDGFSENAQVAGISPFISGNLSMVIETNGFFNSIDRYAPDMNYGIAMIPTVDGSSFASWGAGFSLELTETGNEVSQQVAFDLAVFLTSTDVSIRMILDRGEFVANMDAFDDERVQNDPIWSIMGASGRVTRFRDFIIEFPGWHSVFVTEWDSVLMGLKDADTAMADAEEHVLVEMENFRMLQVD